MNRDNCISKTEEEIIEELSSLEHDQWMRWSKSVAFDIDKLIDLIDMDKLSEEELEFIEAQNARLARWKSYWVPYDELDEKTKDQDREYARLNFDVVKKISKKDIIRSMSNNIF